MELTDSLDAPEQESVAHDAEPSLQVAPDSPSHEDGQSENHDDNGAPASLTPWQNKLLLSLSTTTTPETVIMLLIYRFVWEESLSASSAERLLDLIRAIDSERQHEQSLPTFKTIRNKLQGRSEELYTTIRQAIQLPVEFFGPTGPTIQSVRFKVMEIVAQLLLNESIGEELCTEYEDSVHISGMGSSLVFKELQDRIRLKPGGHQIKLLPLILSYDATMVSKRNCLTPLYVALGSIRLKNGSFPTDAIGCIGFFPTVHHTDTELDQMIQAATGASKTKIMEIIKYTHLFLEQTFLHSVLREIADVYQDNGVLLRVGCRAGTRLVWFAPVVVLLSLDNMGAQKCQTLYTSANCNSPCRLCLIERSQSCRPTPTLPLRGPRITDLQRAAHIDYVRSLQGVGPTTTDNLALCKQLSCHPITSALGDYCELVGLGNLRFAMTPPDEMHTVLGGLMRYFLMWLRAIIDTLPNRRQILCRIDTLMRTYPLQMVPDTAGLRHRFSEGFSGLTAAAKQKKKDTAPSSMGFLDQQRTPALVLQILIILSNSEALPAPHLGIVLRAGFCVMDLHLTLKRPSFRRDAIAELTDAIHSHQLHLLRMFCLKQILLRTRKPLRSTKFHLVAHMPRMIELFGPTQYFDMRQYEASHIPYAKRIYAISSRRADSDIHAKVSRTVALLPVIDDERCT